MKEIFAYLKLLFNGNVVGGCELDSPGSGQGPLAGSCKYGNEHSGSMKAETFLDREHG